MPEVGPGQRGRIGVGGRIEVGVIQQVEEFCSELKLQPSRDVKFLDDPEVDVPKVQTIRPITARSGRSRKRDAKERFGTINLAAIEIWIGGIRDQRTGIPDYRPFDAIHELKLGRNHRAADFRGCDVSSVRCPNSTADSKRFSALVVEDGGYGPPAQQPIEKAGTAQAPALSPSERQPINNTRFDYVPVVKVRARAVQAKVVNAVGVREKLTVFRAAGAPIGSTDMSSIDLLNT